MRDEDGFAEFATGNARRLRHIARLLTGDEHRAEDLLQVALARTYRRWDRVSRSDDPLAYVRRVLVNAHVDWWRRRWRHELPTGQIPDAPAGGDLAADHADRDQLARALAALTPRERSVVVLRYYADLSEADIASTLGMAAGTVKSTSARALAKLRVSPQLTDSQLTDSQLVDTQQAATAEPTREAL